LFLVVRCSSNLSDIDAFTGTGNGKLILLLGYVLSGICVHHVLSIMASFNHNAIQELDSHPVTECVLFPNHSCNSFNFFLSHYSDLNRSSHGYIILLEQEKFLRSGTKMKILIWIQVVLIWNIVPIHEIINNGLVCFTYFSHVRCPSFREW
jgi:hypothetical protein